MNKIDLVNVSIKYYKNKGIKSLFLATDHSAGYDVYSSDDSDIQGFAYVNTDIAISIQNGYEVQFRGRSGIGLKKTMVLGAIYALYGNSGFIKVPIYNYSNKNFFIPKHTRFAQIIFDRVINFKLNEIQENQDIDELSHRLSQYNSDFQLNKQNIFIKIEGTLEMPSQLDRVNNDLDRFAIRAIEDIALLPNASVMQLNSGVKIEIPHGYRGEVVISEDLAMAGVTLAHGIGTIDSDYRGILYTPIANIGSDIVNIKKGDICSYLSFRKNINTHLIDAKINNPNAHEAMSNADKELIDIYVKKSKGDISSAFIAHNNHYISVYPPKNTISIAPYSSICIEFGLRLYLPKFLETHIRRASMIGSDSLDLRVAGEIIIIKDSAFDLNVTFFNASNEAIIISHARPILDINIKNYDTYFNTNVVDSLSATQRNTGGFGSSGL